MALSPVLQMEKQSPRKWGVSAASWRQSQVLCKCRVLPFRSRTASWIGVSIICQGPPPGPPFPPPRDLPVLGAFSMRSWGTLVLHS